MLNICWIFVFVYTGNDGPMLTLGSIFGLNDVGYIDDFVDDKLEMLVTEFRYCWPACNNLAVNQNSEKVTDIINQLPTSENCFDHKVTNIRCHPHHCRMTYVKSILKLYLCQSRRSNILAYCQPGWIVMLVMRRNHYVGNSSTSVTNISAAYRGWMYRIL